MKVLWRSDSKAFALTATLWKQGSNVEVYVRSGSGFRHVELPELLAEIPEKVKGGKSFPHVSEWNAQSAKRWQKDVFSMKGWRHVKCVRLDESEGPQLAREMS
jgi:hypothetical protein